MNLKQSSIIAAVSGLMAAGTASAAFVDFNNEGDLAAYFNIPAGTTTAETHTEAASGGVGNSRAVRPRDSDATGVLKTESFGIEIGQTFTTSMMLKKTNATAPNSRTLQLGLGTATTDTFTTGTELFLSARIDTVVVNPDPDQLIIRVQHRKNDLNLETIDASAQFTLVSDRHYLFTVEIERVAANTYEIGGSLIDYGTDGLTPGSQVVTFDTKTITSTIMNNSPELYAGFRSMFAAGAIRLDNFSAAVPEPTSLGVLAAPAIGLLARRRASR